MVKRYVYPFSDLGDLKGKSPEVLRGILGGKGFGLAQMTELGLPIPRGFTVTTAACIAAQQAAALKAPKGAPTQGTKAGSTSFTATWPQGLEAQLKAAVKELEAATGKRFGSTTAPLLVSVRSGAKMSMPGMMDTVLNLGLNDKTVAALAASTGNRRFALDSYRRFITMFADVVDGVDKKLFDAIFDAHKARRGVKADTGLTEEDLDSVVREFLACYRQKTGSNFPQDHTEQLYRAVNAVFRSWDNDRARAYRDMYSIPHDLGTAVNVQEMVFGNLGNDSATGVAFTRNPSTGENKRYGEYLPNAQGEDVVAGLRTPLPLEDLQKSFPACAAQLFKIFTQLEMHFKDMQDIEFTIEKQKLFVLQTRSGKRTAQAAVHMAAEMVQEGMITAKQAVMRVDAAQVSALLHKQLDAKGKAAAKAEGRLLAKGLPASPGAAVGRAVFSASEAVTLAAEGPVVLVREETSPEDITGMAVAAGVLTARGGQTSHAAVVARGMNRCCVAGAGDVHVDERADSATVHTAAGPVIVRKGDVISLDGSTGEVFLGAIKEVLPQVTESFTRFLALCDSLAKVEVHANADTPADAAVARGYGAKGIGLVRTEHMFFDSQRIHLVRKMILATNPEQRDKALAQLLPHQTADFEGILGAMDGLPVVIRLIDPPLHEFLPHVSMQDLQPGGVLPPELAPLAKDMGTTEQELARKIISMKEFNPMLGFRGCRLGMVHPEINTMQAQAIFTAAVSLARKGKSPRPWIEVPLAGDVAEYRIIADLVRKAAAAAGADGLVKYHVGTMIEVPRAALLADELAKEADFFSFGTNDLTQMTCGFSRDDAGAFLGTYVSKGVYKQDPFISIDQHGVGTLMALCVARARALRPDLDVGICGEHGGDPKSIDFCHRLGLNSVSCSPYRVPIARLAAAQAAVRNAGADAGPSASAIVAEYVKGCSSGKLTARL